MPIGRVPIEDFRVEGAAQPAQHRLMFLMARVAQDFEQVRVAARRSSGRPQIRRDQNPGRSKRSLQT